MTNAVRSTATPRPSSPRCERCGRRMACAGWTPRPDGHGGLRRVPVFGCDDCGRICDDVWGQRDRPRVGDG